MGDQVSGSERYAAWQSNLPWRQSILSGAVRELSKSGSLAPYEHIWSGLSPHLSKEEILAIYRELQTAKVPEAEWIAEFVALFPTVSTAELPRPIGSGPSGIDGTGSPEDIPM